MINFEKFTNYTQEIIFAANAKKDFYKNTGYEIGETLQMSNGRFALLLN